MQRCLVFSLEVGKTAIVRQVIPSIHIEYDRAFCEKLRPHVRKIIWVNGGAGNVSVSSGLDGLDTHSESATVKGHTTASAGNAVQHGEHSPNNNNSGFATVTSLVEILSLRMS